MKVQMLQVHFIIRMCCDTPKFMKSQKLLGRYNCYVYLIAWKIDDTTASEKQPIIQVNDGHKQRSFS